MGGKTDCAASRVKSLVPSVINLAPYRALHKHRGVGTLKLFQLEGLALPGCDRRAQMRREAIESTRLGVNLFTGGGVWCIFPLLPQQVTVGVEYTPNSFMPQKRVDCLGIPNRLFFQ